MVNFLAQQQASEALTLSGGFSWWQTLGGLALVFGLLLLCLRLLGRLQRGSTHAPAKLLAVWSVGPKREVQALRLDDEVHYIYRHDGAMVLLKHQDLSEWERSQAGQPSRAPNAGSWRNWGIWPLRKAPVAPSPTLPSTSKS